MANKIYVGSIGVEIIVDCGENITGAENTFLHVKKPDNKQVSWPATAYQTNYLKYTSAKNDLNQAGDYKLQAALTLSGWSGLGATATFRVYKEFN